MSYIPEPITRIDKYLAYIAGNMDVALPDHPITRKEHYLAAWAEKSGFEDVDVAGEPPLTLENAIGKPLKGLKIYGRSEQMTTTGAQLLDLDAISLATGGGATIKRLDDGGFLVDGTPKKAYEQYITKVVINLAPGTYFVSGGRAADGCAAVQINILNADGTRTYKNNVSFDVLGTEQEITLVIQSVSEAPINNYKIYPMINSGSVAVPFEPYTGGKPSPSPDYPQEIQSAGDDGNLSVIVKNPDNEQMQSVSFSTPNGLPGIPVTSGGNYTDADGQQWVCDEIDFTRGVYVQRIVKEVLNGTEQIKWISQIGDVVRFSIGTKYHVFENYNADISQKGLKGFFSHGTYYTNYSLNDIHGYADGENLFIFLPIGILENNADSIAAYVNEQYENGSPLTMHYIVATQIETPLTSDQLAAYKALRTYKGTTIIDNDAGAYMSVRYEKMK